VAVSWQGSGIMRHLPLQLEGCGKVCCTDAGLKEQLGNNVTDIIDWGVQVNGSRPPPC
jgi:hypothetical protein